jgi:hypothetical protein
MSARNDIPVQPQMKLLNILREVCGELTIPFGHGLRSYANLQTRRGIYESEKKFPRAYLYPVNIRDTNKYAIIESTYECVMDFLTLCPMRSTQEEIEAHLYDMHLLTGSFIKKLSIHNDVKMLDNINREPNYHIFDENLCGWMLKFDIVIYEPQPLC